MGVPFAQRQQQVLGLLQLPANAVHAPPDQQQGRQQDGKQHGLQAVPGLAGVGQVGFKAGNGRLPLLARQPAQLFHTVGHLPADEQCLLFGGVALAWQQLQQRAGLGVIAHQVGLDIADLACQRGAAVVLCAQR